MDPVTLGVVALMGAVATIGGAAEDLESDIGSQSNPNSQVQLAPQMGHLHRMINKAASGEPVAYGVWCGIAGAVAYILINMFGLIPGFPVIAIAIGACVAAVLTLDLLILDRGGIFHRFDTVGIDGACQCIIKGFDTFCRSVGFHFLNRKGGISHQLGKVGFAVAVLAAFHTFLHHLGAVYRDLRGDGKPAEHILSCRLRRLSNGQCHAGGKSDGDDDNRCQNRSAFVPEYIAKCVFENIHSIRLPSLRVYATIVNVKWVKYDGFVKIICNFREKCI